MKRRFTACIALTVPLAAIRWRHPPSRGRRSLPPVTVPTRRPREAADVRATVIQLYRSELDDVRREHARLARESDPSLQRAHAECLAAARRRLTTVTARFDGLLREI
jgi:hypothetical protein